ncbi:Lipase 2 [compost metagenome]
MGPNLNIPVRMYQHPEKPAKEALVWVHGGAFLMGDLDMPESHWVGLMLAALGIPVVALDYVKALHGKDFRLVNRDVLTGWQWALERLQKIGISNQDVHFGGASAGANLVACVSKQLRDDEELLPASLLLMYPALHGAFPGVPTGLLKRVRTKARALCFEPDWLVDLGLHYAGYKAAESEPYAFAANGYVGGLPPTLIANCECDTLRVSGEAFACQLRDAGVAVQLHEVANTVHGSLNTPDRVEAVHMLLLMLDWIRGKR